MKSKRREKIFPTEKAVNILRFRQPGDAFHRRGSAVSKLRSAVSVEQYWKDVFPSRAAFPSLETFVARQETRKPLPRVPG